MSQSPSNNAGVVVIGGGQASAQVCDALRRERYTGPITMISGEPHAPYQRPPLSKEFLAAKCEADWLSYRPDDFYRTNNVSLILGKRAVGIDRAARRVQLDDGSSVPYASLVLGTGCSPRRLRIPGGDLPGVCYLRTLEEAREIRERLKNAQRVVVIGGGFIGLEVAAVLRAQAKQVTVIEAQDRVLPRVVGARVSQFAHDTHSANGVKLVVGASVNAIRSVNGALEVVCGDQTAHAADVVIVGIGVIPETELAAGAGLTIDNGIAVDEYCRTNDADIYAVGDCASHPNSIYGRRVRFETVQNAVEQARAVARTLSGKPTQYAQVAWVWSDQYQYRFQMVGHNDGADLTVLRGDPGAGSFSIFYFANGVFTGMNGINRPAEFAACRRILNERLGLTPAQASDAKFDLVKYAPLRKRMEFDRPWSTPRNAAVRQEHARP